MVFNLVFAKNITLLCFYLFFFVITDLYFLIFAVIAKIFCTSSELATPTGIATREANAKINTYPAIVETKIKKFSI